MRFRTSEPHGRLGWQSESSQWNSCSLSHQHLFSQHSFSPPYFKVAKLYSPLFIRCCAPRHNLAATSKGIKKRTKQRFNKPALTSKVLASKMANGSQETWKENLNNTMICPECKEFPPNLKEEFSCGDMVCGSCGLVLGDRIVDTRSEWRTFSNDDQGNDDPSRVGDGANPLLNGSQLQTSIAFNDGANGRSRDLHRAQNKATHDKSTKTLLAAYKELGAFCDSINIPSNVANYAKHLFKKVDDAKAFKGKSQDTIIAGCIFIACRQLGVPRTFREIFALTKVSKAEIGRIFKALEKFFDSENRKKKIMAEQAGGKSFSVGKLIHYVLLTWMYKNSSTPRTITLLNNRLILKRSATASATSSASTSGSLLSLKILPRGLIKSARSPVALRCPLQQRASTPPRILWVSQSLPRRYPE